MPSKYKFEPVDVISVILLVGVIVLNFRGVDTMLSQSVLLMVGFYFGKKGQIISKQDQNGEIL